MSWMVRTPRGDEGPFDLDQLRFIIRTGDLYATDELRDPEDSGTVRADELPELRSAFAELERSTVGLGASIRCSLHEQADALWYCNHCAAGLCGRCVRDRRDAEGQAFTTCSACGRPVRPRGLAGSGTVPFQLELPLVLRFPLYNLLLLLLVTLLWVGMRVFAWAFGLAGLFDLVACGMLFFGFYHVLHQSADGARRLRPLRGFIDSIAIPGSKALIVSLVVLSPWLVWQRMVVPGLDESAAGLPLPLGLDSLGPIQIAGSTLLGLCTLFVWPMALVLLTLTGRLLVALNLVLLLKLVARLRGAYLSLTAFVGSFLLLGLLAVLALVHTGWPGVLLGAAVSLYVLTVSFHAMGRFACFARERLDAL